MYKCTNLTLLRRFIYTTSVPGLLLGDTITSRMSRVFKKYQLGHCLLKGMTVIMFYSITCQHEMLILMKEIG